MRPLYYQPLILTLLFLTGISASSVVRAETFLEIRFTDRNVSFSGNIDSEETGQRLAGVVRSVRPDLAIINAGINVSQDVVMPDMKDLENVLTELGLSTHEGRIEIRPGSILIGGVTDSIVTITALRIRIQSLMEGRRFINRICVVTSDDLPDIKVSLSANEGESELLDFEYHPSKEERYEAPGFPLSKWFPTFVMLSDFDRLEGKKKALLVAQPLIAMPIGDEVTRDTDLVFEALEEEDSIPQLTYETIGSIRFSRNAFLLQANQEPMIEALSKALTSPAFKGIAVILKPIKASGGSGAYRDYLCEKRAGEVKQILLEIGLLPTNISTEVSVSSSPIDSGEVFIVVKSPSPLREELTDGGAKIMFGTTTTPARGGAEDPKESRETEGMIPEHPLKRIRLNLSRDPE